MKTRDIIGRRIVKVEQSYGRTWGGGGVMVDRIVLDNGIELVPVAYLTDDDPVGDILVVKPSKP